MKKNHFLILLVSICLIGNVTAQTPDWLWAKGMGGTGDDGGNAVAVDATGNVYTAGIFSGTADFDPGPGVFNLMSAGATDIFISKLDASGNFLWAKAMGGNGIPACNGMVVTASGNVYTTGDFNGTIDFNPGTGVFNLTATPFSGWNDIFISKLDSSGNFVWAKALEGPADKKCNSVAIDTSGNCYITGYFENSLDADPGPGQFYLSASSGQSVNAFIIKLNNTGTFGWAKKFGGVTFENVYGQGIALDASNNVYTTGYFAGMVDFDPGVGTYNLSSVVGFSIYISKLNNAGSFVWAKEIGGSSSNGCIGKAIAVDTMGNVCTTGNFSGTADFDPSAAQYNITAAGIPQALFISKLNSAGNFVWAKAIDGSGYEEGYSIAADATGNVYTLGYCFGTIDVDPGPGVYNLLNGGFFISELDISGNFVWAKLIDAEVEGNRSFFLDPSANIFVTGTFYNDSLFCGSDTLVNADISGASGDVFTGKLSDLTTEIENLENLNYFSLFPNPSNESFTVVFNNVMHDASITVHDTFGKIIYTSKVISSRFDVRLSNTPAGIYFLRISDGEMQYSKKIIVQ